MSKRKCPICSCEFNTKIDKIKLVIPKEYHLPSEYDIVECQECGFCYSDTDATVDDYNNYYTNCNTYSGTPVDSQEWIYLHNKVGEMLDQKISRSDYILDMGFGKGNFLLWLRNNGYTHVLGIDPSEDSVRHIEKMGIRAIVGSVFDSPLEECRKQIKCICLFDVLEHLLYPKEAICNMREYLQEDGYLMISVPNYAYLEKNQAPITNMFNQEHINYFSVVSLDNIMAECGFGKVENNMFQQQEEEIIALYQMNQHMTYSREKDIYCSEEIRNYIARFNNRKELIQEKLQELQQRKCDEIYVWGTGAFTMWLLANTSLASFLISFIDNNETKIGNTFWNGTISGADVVVDDKKPIVICSMLYAEQIRVQIENMGLQNPIVIL